MGYLWKIYTAGTYFTRPSVVTVAANLNSGVVGGRCVGFWKYFYCSSCCLSIFNHENGSQSSHIKRAFTSKSCFVKVKVLLISFFVCLRFFNHNLHLFAEVTHSGCQDDVRGCVVGGRLSLGRRQEGCWVIWLGWKEVRSDFPKLAWE